MTALFRPFQSEYVYSFFSLLHWLGLPVWGCRSDGGTAVVVPVLVPVLEGKHSAFHHEVWCQLSGYRCLFSGWGSSLLFLWIVCWEYPLPFSDGVESGPGDSGGKGETQPIQWQFKHWSCSIHLLSLPFQRPQIAAHICPYFIVKFSERQGKHGLTPSYSDLVLLLSHFDGK